MTRIEYVGSDWDPYYAELGVRTFIIHAKRCAYIFHLWPEGDWMIERRTKTLRYISGVDGRISPRTCKWLLSYYNADVLKMEALL